MDKTKSNLGVTMKQSVCPDFSQQCLHCSENWLWPRAAGHFLARLIKTVRFQCVLSLRIVPSRYCHGPTGPTADSSNTEIFTSWIAVLRTVSWCADSILEYAPARHRFVLDFTRYSHTSPFTSALSQTKKKIISWPYSCHRFVCNIKGQANGLLHRLSIKRSQLIRPFLSS